MKAAEATRAAEKVAREAHKGQTRWGGEPYITHPEAVALEVGEAFKAAAWLHDVIEDTDLTTGDLREMGFSEETVHAVDLLSKKEGQDYLEYILAIKSHPIARVVKAADLRHNLSDLDSHKGKKTMKAKYELAHYILTGRRGHF